MPSSVAIHTQNWADWILNMFLCPSSVWRPVLSIYRRGVASRLVSAIRLAFSLSAFFVRVDSLYTRTHTLSLLSVWFESAVRFIIVNCYWWAPVRRICFDAASAQRWLYAWCRAEPLCIISNRAPFTIALAVPLPPSQTSTSSSSSSSAAASFSGSCEFFSFGFFCVYWRRLCYVPYLYI